MIQIGDKEYRNLQEQVGKNMADIKKIKQSLGNALPDPIPGPDGPQGVSITSVAVNADNDLIISYSDGTTQNAGRIKTLQGIRGPKGNDGAPGKSISDLTSIDASLYEETVSPGIENKTTETIETSALLDFGDIQKSVDLKFNYQTHTASSNNEVKTVVFRNEDGCASIGDNLLPYGITNNRVVKDYAYRPNLLINSNFKINQRGSLDYQGANSYTVDGWKIKEGLGSVHVITGGISIDAVPLSVIKLAQPIETELTGYAAALSVAVEVDGVEQILSSSGVIQNNDQKQCVGEEEDFSIYLKQTATDSGLFEFYIETEIDIIVKWAKLEAIKESELGEIKSTPYVQPNPAEELVKCQRYLMRLSLGISLGYSPGGQYVFVSVQTPTTLRPGMPTIDVSTVIRIGNDAATINNISRDNSISNSIELELYTGETYAAGTYCIVSGSILVRNEL